MRERKTTKVVDRNQLFALLLRVLNVLSALVRNKRLLSRHSVNSIKIRPRASSTSFITIARVSRRLYRKHKEREKRKNYEQEINEENSLILSGTRKTDTPASLQKNRLLG